MTKEQGQEVQERVDTINVLSSLGIQLCLRYNEQSYSNDVTGYAIVVSVAPGLLKHVALYDDRSGNPTGPLAEAFKAINEHIKSTLAPHIKVQKDKIREIMTA